MASDRLIFKSLSKVNSKTQVPVLATILGTLTSCFLAFFVGMEDLVDFLSIGTLLAYLIVALALIVLRYSPRDVLGNDQEYRDSEPCDSEKTQLVRSENRLKPLQVKLLVALIILILAMNGFITAIPWVPEKYAVPNYLMIGFFLLLTVIDLSVLSVISKDNSHSPYCKVPFVPFLPALSIAVNSYLMMQLSLWTWVRLTVWMTVGFLIYFFYGIKNSVAQYTNTEDGEIDSGFQEMERNEHSGETTICQGPSDSPVLAS